MLDDHARARRVQEQEPRPGRTPFQRDRARVLHSGALRRLAGKTQVVEPLGAQATVPRTRLTHSLECAQIGRELGAVLGCDPDLVDAACLAHDLGHPPFGHNGELALDAVAQEVGGFEGNAQSFRLLTRLEVKVEGAGLNLTRATLDAATKYPWPRGERTKYGVYDDDLEAFAWVRTSAPGERRCFESQVMDWADDVAYSVHDVEDGVLAGLIDLDDFDGVVEKARELYSDAPARDLQDALDGLRQQPWWPRPGGGEIALKRATSTLIGRFCTAAQEATRSAHGPGDLTRYGADLEVPAETRDECAVLKALTALHVMGRPGANELQERERQVVTELVGALEGDLRDVVDRVASLTDAAALALHRQVA